MLIVRLKGLYLDYDLFIWSFVLKENQVLTFTVDFGQIEIAEFDDFGFLLTTTTLAKH